MTYTPPEPRSITAADLMKAENGNLIELVGYTVLIHISETDANGETQEAKVVGTVETFVILDGSLAIKLEGTADPVAISEDDASNVTIYSYGGL